MSKIIIRNGIFETNSSSVHSICISKKPVENVKGKKIAFYLGEYGWENETVDTTDYLYTAIMCQSNSEELLDKKLIWGLGISLREPTDAFINLVKTIPNAVIHTINGILTESDLNRLANHDLKILILGYKTTGRGLEYRSNNLKELGKNTTYLGLMLPTIVKEGWFKNLSFDNLAIKQLNVKRLMSEEEWERFYMGDDGTFTFYIDLVNQTFSKNAVELAKACGVELWERY